MLGALRARVVQTTVARQAAVRSASLFRPATSAALLHARPMSSSVTIVVPPIADSISEGTLAEHCVAEGGAVAVDQVVAKLDTDKVSVDIRATAQGKLSKWIAQVGDTVKVGAPLLTIEAGAAGTAAPEAAKPVAPVLTPAGAPSSDVDSKATQPRAQSGAQAPQSVHPTDPADDHHRRIPSIAFRYGKRDAAGSVGGAPSASHQHQGNQVSYDISGGDFLAANEAAAAAYDALPQRYKRRQLKVQELDIIELGGAPNYEPKKKKAAA